ncbi:DUF3048 domain-containing protein [Streptomyces thermocoprophilus]|uniref:DUF3048 domain-containing protein n=1 Tax=Streptomyces thermocoprophilus TaxID=78356 RepID=A0ABV5VH64_9ACTN
MQRDGRTRRAKRARAAALLAAVVATLAAACTTPSAPPDDGKPAGSSRSTPDSPSPRHHRSVLAVKIDNARAARPHTGLDAADIVYVEQVEGGLSRLMAVYATRLPPAIGPVRSARESDLELLRQFERPTLAFSGAQKKLLPLIDEAPLRPETPGATDDAFYRGTDRPAPHNLYLRPDRLLPRPPGRHALTTGFRYGPAPAGGTETASRTVRFPAATFRFTWSEELRGYRVSMDGVPTVTTDAGPVAPPTVVVQYVKIQPSRFQDFLGNRTPYTQTVGSGRAEVLRDGRSYEAAWERPTATDGTRFTTPEGLPMRFADGQVWVVLAAAP